MSIWAQIHPGVEAAVCLWQWSGRLRWLGIPSEARPSLITPCDGGLCACLQWSGPSCRASCRLTPAGTDHSSACWCFPCTAAQGWALFSNWLVCQQTSCPISLGSGSLEDGAKQGHWTPSRKRAFQEPSVPPRPKEMTQCWPSSEGPTRNGPETPSTTPLIHGGGSETRGENGLTQAVTESPPQSCRERQRGGADCGRPRRRPCPPRTPPACSFLTACFSYFAYRSRGWAHDVLAPRPFSWLLKMVYGLSL